MKKLFMILSCMVFVIVFATCAMAGKGGVKGSSNSNVVCSTIPDGVLYSSSGDLIVPGYDQWGYNYQAHMFNGGYCDSYRDASWCQAYRDVDLIMKWNEAWLSHKDCGDDSGDTSSLPDGKLDRHFGYPSYRGSGAWITNHQSGEVEVNGKMRRWTYFVKIVAAPLDATVDDGVWYAADGTEIGPVIWGSFATIQTVSNDPSYGEHGVLYKSPVGPGFGQYKP